MLLRLLTSRPPRFRHFLHPHRLLHNPPLPHQLPLPPEGIAFTTLHCRTISLDLIL